VRHLLNRISGFVQVRKRGALWGGLGFERAAAAQQAGESSVVEPCLCLGVAAQPGVPPGGAGLADEAMEFCILSSRVPASGEGHVIRAVEGEQAGGGRGHFVKRNASLRRVGVADWAVVQGAGHVEERGGDGGEFGRRKILWSGAAHLNGRADAGIGEGGAGKRQRLTDGDHGAPSAEGMARHADVFEVEAAGERGVFVGIEAREFIDNEGDVLRAFDGDEGIVRGLAKDGLDLRGREAFPD